MSTNGIFVVSEDGLSKLRRAPFDTEDDFQTLLERYPDLLSGDQSISPHRSCKWLLVAPTVRPERQADPERLGIFKEAIPQVGETLHGGVRR